MIVSCYDYRLKLWHYYEVPGTYDRSTRYRALTQKPQGSRELGGIGYAPEALGVPLPPGARQVGTGREARGIVAFDPRPASAALGTMSVPMTPSMPSQWEETMAGASVGTLGGMGATDVVEVQTRSTPFIQVVAASSIAAVVGVIVTRALSKKKRGAR